jgi:hypothetical protein
LETEVTAGGSKSAHADVSDQNATMPWDHKGGVRAIVAT